MATVYVLNDRHHDYSEALEYGPLEFVTTDMVPVFKVDRLTKIVKENLMMFTPDDYLLISGPAVLTTIATTHIMLRYGTVNILVHDARHKRYVARKLQLNMMEG
jgi:hypothetical protein